MDTSTVGVMINKIPISWRCFPLSLERRSPTFYWIWGSPSSGTTKAAGTSACLQMWGLWFSGGGRQQLCM